ncbi:MAG: hypothetical protein AMS20_00165 [Gemmatimonas sp. SG8_28]|nr:MAG: hypothetical protein AMS20_00165 [Gemmatimonas sp. SG8_28]
MARITIANWSRFQHYKHRSPPWIKLHRSLLDNREWVDLPPDAAKLLVGLWLLAAEGDGEIDLASDALAWRLRLPDSSTEAISRQLNELHVRGFIVLAGCLHDASTMLDRVEESRVEERYRVPDGTLVELEPGVAIAPTSGNGNRTPTRSGTRLPDIQEHLAAVLAAVSEERVSQVGADDLRRVQAELVFAYWAHRTGHTKALFDPKRETRLVQALKRNGGDVHQLLYAIDGWFRDPTFKRMADEGRKLDGIQNIFTDQERIERLADHQKPYQEGKPHPMAVKYLGAAHPQEEVNDSTMGGPEAR